MKSVTAPEAKAITNVTGRVGHSSAAACGAPPSVAATAIKEKALAADILRVTGRACIDEISNNCSRDARGRGQVAPANYARNMKVK
jgi:hypothetical protein